MAILPFSLMNRSVKSPRVRLAAGSAAGARVEAGARAGGGERASSRGTPTRLCALMTFETVARGKSAGRGSK